MNIVFIGPNGMQLEFMTDTGGGVSVISHGQQRLATGFTRDVDQDVEVIRLSKNELKKLATFLEVFLSSQQSTPQSLKETLRGPATPKAPAKRRAG